MVLNKTLLSHRVIVLILLLLVIIPLLNVNDTDVSLQLGVQLVHKLAQLNASDPKTYEVRPNKFVSSVITVIL